MAKRRVSEDERVLLDLAMRAVKPLRKATPPHASKTNRLGRKAKSQGGGVAAGDGGGPSRAARAAGGPAVADAAKIGSAVLPPGHLPGGWGRKGVSALQPVDRRMEQKLKRGWIEIDATLDLHGMTQGAAHKRLNAFLKRAAADGHRRVLVITGKGRACDGGEAGFMPSDRRGVLRQAVPRWIAEPPLCDLVWGLKAAGPRHGGAGALYVLLKKAARE